jgi:hypothetical protein
MWKRAVENSPNVEFTKSFIIRDEKDGNSNAKD